MDNERKSTGLYIGDLKIKLTNFWGLDNYGRGKFSGIVKSEPRDSDKKSLFISVQVKDGNRYENIHLPSYVTLKNAVLDGWVGEKRVGNNSVSVNYYVIRATAIASDESDNYPQPEGDKPAGKRFAKKGSFKPKAEEPESSAPEPVETNEDSVADDEANDFNW